MVIDKQLRIAILLSIGVHSLLLGPWSDFISASKKTSFNKNIEVNYIVNVLKSKPIPPKKFLTLPKKIDRTSLQDRGANNITKRRDRPEIHTNNIGPLRKKVVKEKAEYKSKESLGKITVKEVEFSKKSDVGNTLFLDDSGRSSALSYPKSIRNKINFYVQRNYDVSMGEGEAVIRFVLNPDGTVRNVSIIEDRLGPNRRLRNLCLDSIYHSSPFSPFPEGLNLPYAAFNISISFRKGDER